MKRIALGMVAALIATGSHADDRVRLYWRDVRGTLDWRGKVSLPTAPATAVERGSFNALWDPMELILASYQKGGWWFGGWFAPDGVQSWIALGTATVEQCKYENQRRANRELRAEAVCPPCDGDDVAAVCQRPL